MTESIDMDYDTFKKGMDKMKYLLDRLDQEVRDLKYDVSQLDDRSYL